MVVSVRQLSTLTAEEAAILAPELGTQSEIITRTYLIVKYEILLSILEVWIKSGPSRHKKLPIQASHAAYQEELTLTRTPHTPACALNRAWCRILWG